MVMVCLPLNVMTGLFFCIDRLGKKGFAMENSASQANLFPVSPLENPFLCSFQRSR
jgi:hypothetical protein